MTPSEKLARYILENEAWFGTASHQECCALLRKGTDELEQDGTDVSDLRKMIDIYEQLPEGYRRMVWDQVVGLARQTKTEESGGN